MDSLTRPGAGPHEANEPMSTAYPDRTTLSLPRGWLRRVDQQAATEGRSRGDWLRHAVRRALETADRQARRDRQAGAS